jgi:hypothetical protein
LEVERKRSNKKVYSSKNIKTRGIMKKFRFKKVTPIILEEMKKAREEGMFFKDIAVKFGLSLSSTRYHFSEKEREYKKKIMKKYSNEQRKKLTPEQRKEKTKKHQPYLSKYIMDRYHNDKEFKKRFNKIVYKNFKKRSKIWREKGLCASCGGEKINKRFPNCERCREIARNRKKKGK